MATSTTTTPPLFASQREIVKRELCDPDVLCALLRDSQSFAKDDLKRLGQYARGRRHGNEHEVVYHYGKDCEALKVGRLYAKDNQGLQSFPFDMRNPLLQKHYWDIDMENCHYWLLRQFCELSELKHDGIAQYCDNREASLRAVSSNRDVAKVAFLKVAYGGNIKLYNEHSSVDSLPPDGDVSLLRLIEKEIAVVIAVLKQNAPELYALAEKKTQKGKKGNTDFTLLAYALQTEECKCLLAMDEYLQSVGRSVDVLIHDGCMVRKLENETVFPTELLRGAEQHIVARTGYKMRLVNKPITHNFAPPATSAEVIDDEYAARKFVGLMGDLIAREDNDIYYFNEMTGLWSSNDNAYLCSVVKHKPNLIWKIPADDGKTKTLNYGGCKDKVNAMRSFIPTCVPDTQFLSRNADSSYGKLLFADGIYDFYTGAFTAGFDPRIVFNKRIDRKFPLRSSCSEALIKEVRDTLFVNAFNEEDGTAAGDYLRKALCMGLVGDYTRKKFYFGLGEANCGKGVMVCAFTNAFGDYIAEWNANELKYNAKNGQDEARKLAWVKNLQGTRLAFSNELRMDRTPIDGNLLKAVSSGGDQIKARANYENEQKFINRSTLFLLANDMLPITPKDSGIQTRCRFIRYKLRFVSDPAATDERKADPTIKTKFAREDWKDALFFVMVDTFAELSASEKERGGLLPDPACVIEETKEWVGDDGSGDFEDTIRLRYDITGLAEDSVPSKDIVEYIQKEKRMALSDNKIGRMLTKLIKAKNPELARDRNAAAGEVGKQRLGLRER